MNKLVTELFDEYLAKNPGQQLLANLGRTKLLIRSSELLTGLKY